jgi:hypothetical protein
MIPEDPIDPVFRAQVEEALRAELPGETLDPGLVDNLCRILATRGEELDAAHAAKLYRLYHMAGKHSPSDATDPGPEGEHDDVRNDPRDAGPRLTSAEVPLPPSLRAPTIPGCEQLTPEGSGGFCTSYHAIDADTGQRVRVEVFRAGHEVDLRSRWHFLAPRTGEPHPHLLRLRRHGWLDDGSDYLVFDGPEGIRLSEFLSRQGPLSVARACGCARQVALGLQAVHADGYIHLDIKPFNLLVSLDGQRVWIADYALVRPAGSGPEGCFAGTLAYMAPEQARGLQYTDARTDLYGLGCTLYEMLAGKPLFATSGRQSLDLVMAAIARTGSPALSFVQEVPASVQRVLHRLLAADPAQR